MNYKFFASHTFNEDDGFTAMLGFSDDQFEPSKFLIVQRAHEYDDQDIKLGMDNLHIQLEDQSRAYYGGVTSISVVANTLLLKLNHSAKSSLLVDGDIEIILDLNNPNLKETLLELELVAEREKIPFKK